MPRFKQIARAIAALIIAFAFTNADLYAQSKITDYVIFGGSSATGLTNAELQNRGVFIGSATNIASGKVGSATQVKTTGSVQFATKDATKSGGIFSWGVVNLANSNTIVGDIKAGNLPVISPNATFPYTIQAGSSLSIIGNIHSAGNILLSGGTVNGNVYHSGPYSGLKLGTKDKGAIGLSIPSAPAMPKIYQFTPGTVPVKGSARLTPEYYGDVVLTGNQKLTLVGPGVFYFNSLKLDNSNNIEFDFQNANGSFEIYIAGDAELGRCLSTMINLPTNTTSLQAAGRIFTQVGGTGSTTASKNAFNIANGTTKASSWLGTVWAPYGSIGLGSGSGSSNLTGALISGTRVTIQSAVTIYYAPFNEFVTPPPSDLEIIPAYNPPAGGKANEPVGPELITLCRQYNSNEVPNPDIYTIVENKVLIEIIVKDLANRSAIISSLSTLYGFEESVDNGPNAYLITGQIPIDQICPLNNNVNITALINSFRPLYRPLKNSGPVTSQGDTAQMSNLAREAFGITGDGLTIGVLSDSYNRTLGNPTASSDDVQRGELPGAPGSTVNSMPVNVIRDLKGLGADEGRAMLQIVHDVAPKAKLAFRTGFEGEADLANGIIELAAAGCNIITDDISYITAPFYRDGVVAKAINKVKTDNNVAYFTAAGNYGAKSYEAVFSPSATKVPAVSGSVAHGFGGSDVYQGIGLTFEPNNSYTIVLQWDDPFYSLGQGGALNDLDMYLSNNDGTIVFGMNRYNAGKDPIEVLAFSVTKTTTSNLVITRASGSTQNLRMKYVVFRGKLDINEYQAGNSTIVGHQNAVGAMTIGASYFKETPAYGSATPLLEPYSSVGGTSPVEGINRQKPDFVAPDGGNTSFFGGDVVGDNDVFPNFFGTSAAAPHAAASAALIMEAHNKYVTPGTSSYLNPDQVRLLMSSTALPMNVQGSGAGLIQTYSSIITFASPKPVLDKIELGDVVPSTTSEFTLKITGNYLTPDSKVYVGNTPVNSSKVVYKSPQELMVTFPPLTERNPAIRLYNAPKTANGDGGYSDPKYFFQKLLVIKADDKTKVFGDKMPPLTFSVTIDDKTVTDAGYTNDDIMFDKIVIGADATSTTNVGFIGINIGFDASVPADDPIYTNFVVRFENAVLTVLPKVLKVSPVDVSAVYGDKFTPVDFKYDYDESNIADDEKGSFKTLVGNFHNVYMDQTGALGLVPGGNTITAEDLANLSMMATNAAIRSAAIRSAAIRSGGTFPLPVVDLALSAFEQYTPNTNLADIVVAPPTDRERGIFNLGAGIRSGVGIRSAAIRSGAGIRSAAIRSAAIRSAVDETSNTNVGVIVDQDDLDLGDEFEVPSAINLVTGLTSGQHFIVPAAFLSSNFKVSYGLGNLTIGKSVVTVTVMDSSILEGDAKPTGYKYTVSGLKYSDKVITEPVFTLTPDYTGQAGTYTISASGLEIENQADFEIVYVDGDLYVDAVNTNGANVKPSLDCISIITNDPSGFGYEANFRWVNNTTSVVKIVPGANNYLTGSAQYSGTLPTFFAPGTGTFKIKFDGNRLVWNIKSSGGIQKTSVASEASSTSNRCNSKLDAVVTQASARQIQNASAMGSYATGISPNPTTGRFVVTSEAGTMSDRDVFISDLSGKKITPKKVNRFAPNSLQIDMPATAAPGVYMLRVKVDNGYQVFRVVKL